ncbi:MAG: hypothetical protein JXA96_11880 [Sedimentisphaerales bacterium]|nr:hypothetical protein [Sedimentisphaerales bacterium]
MNNKDYFVRLGTLVSNLQSLEFFLRVYLQQMPDSKPFGIPKGKDIYQYPVGSELPLNDITSYDTLNDLIRKHNKYAVKQGEEIVDESIVDLRDALAHGRVSASSPNSSLRLLKFSRPNRTNKDKVLVKFNEVLSLDYLDQQIKRIHAAIMIVNAKLINQ